MPENLNIGVHVDVGPLNDFAAASTNVARNVDVMAASFLHSGMSAGDAASALRNLGFSAKEAASALGEEAAAAGRADAATGNMGSRMGMARVELGALSGSAGMVESGFARLVASSQALAPVLAAAFTPLAIIAFGDIVVHVGEKMYDLYQNIVLDKDELEAFAKVEDSVVEATARLSRETESAYIAYLKIVDPIESARERLRSLADDRFTFHVDTKELDKFTTWRSGPGFENFIKELTDFPANELDSQMKRVTGSIATLQAQLNAPVMRGVLDRSELEAQLKLLQDIQVAMTQMQTRQGVQQKLGTAGLGKDQDEADKKAAEAQEAVVRKKQEAAYRAFEFLNREQELAAKGAEEELKQIDAVAKKKEEAAKKAFDDAWKEFDQVQAAQEAITREVQNEIQKRATLAKLQAQTDAVINARLDEASRKAVEEEVKAYEKSMAQINRSLESVTRQALSGSITVQEAFRRMGENMVIDVVTSLEKMALQFVEKEIMMTVIHATQSEARVATTAVAAGQTEAITAVSSLHELGHAAVVAAANAWTALAGIPIVGPALGAAAAAATFTAVMALGALAGAEQGAIIPRDMPILAHGGEMVLPRHLSEGMAGLIEGGGKGGNTAHVAVNINALDAANVSDFFGKNSSKVSSVLRRAVRDGLRR